MDNKLIPAHVLFARWFIRIRWVALIFLVLSCLLVKHVFEISIREKSIYILSVILLILNIIHSLILRNIVKGEDKKVIPRIKKEIHFQIISDLIILTLILHYTGGIENPLILFFFFHMIIASSIFSTLQSYLYASYGIVLTALLAILECYSIIPHYQLTGVIDHNLYSDPLYIFGAGFIFALTSFLVVSLSHMIIYRSIKSEETYVKTNMELENKDKVKNEYVLRVTHDIKGHVAAILSCLEVIRSGMTGKLNPEQEEFANRAYERTEQLSMFVNNLLNLTRKRLKHDNEFEEFSLKDLIDKIIVPVQTLAKDKSIDFNVAVDKSLDRIIGNPFTIEELYCNILLNAIKYTPANGHISLTVKNRINNVITEISDSGIGIPEEELKSVFEEFYRASNVPRDIKGGSGLGLSIVKQIVENHNGKISVASEPGIWTKFTFILPKNPVTGL
jgi:signal transduction histidine kinase